MRDLLQIIDYDKDQLSYALANALKERDEARDIAEKLSKQGLDMMDENLSLKRERDEAREELHDIRLNLGEDADGYTLLHAVCVIQNERDEAREALKRIYQASMVAKSLEEDFAEWEKAIEMLLDLIKKEAN